MLTNLHTHSTFCDGRDSAEAMVEAALEKGFAVIGFSSHSDMLADPVAYRDEIRRLEKVYAGRIKVRLGLELELAKPIPAWVRTLGLDYVIGSHHFLTAPDGGFFAIDNTPEELEKGIRDHFEGSAEAFVRAYYAALRETLGGPFEIVGHPDLVRKFNEKRPWFDENAAWYLEEVEKTARAIAASGKIVEVNTGAIARGWLADAYPSADFRARLEALHVPLILSSDAHARDGIDCQFDRFARFREIPPCQTTPIYGILS